jgi:hypothetical protein
MARSARERRMENCANSKTAVIESFTNMVAAYMGTNGTIRGTLILERNAVVAKNATSMTSTTARARRFWARLGAKLESMKSCSSDAVGAIFPAVITGSFMVHLVCSRPRYLGCDGIISRRPARGGSLDGLDCIGARTSTCRWW